MSMMGRLGSSDDNNHHGGCSAVLPARKAPMPAHQAAMRSAVQALMLHGTCFGDHCCAACIQHLSLLHQHSRAQIEQKPNVTRTAVHYDVDIIDTAAEQPGRRGEAWCLCFGACIFGMHACLASVACPHPGYMC